MRPEWPWKTGCLLDDGEENEDEEVVVGVRNSDGRLTAPNDVTEYTIWPCVIHLYTYRGLKTIQ